MTKIIIKSAIYTDGNELLRPHYSGEFHIVDCTEYKTKKQIKEEYSYNFQKQFLKGIYLTYNGEKYYECEYNPFYTEHLELLSDISKLEFFDDEGDF